MLPNSLVKRCIPLIQIDGRILIEYRHALGSTPIDIYLQLILAQKTEAIDIEKLDTPGRDALASWCNIDHYHLAQNLYVLEEAGLVVFNHATRRRPYWQISILPVPDIHRRQVAHNIRSAPHIDEKFALSIPTIERGD